MSLSAAGAMGVQARSKAGRKPSLSADHVEALRVITQEMPRCSLDELTRELHRRAGVVVCSATVRKALRAAGIRRMKPERVAPVRAAVQGTQPTRYGYSAAHRREDCASGMNTDLTDAEWALVGDLFERKGRRGKPPTYERRQLVNACCYVVRTGCAWRLLPHDLPHWKTVYTYFRLWRLQGLWETIHDRLRDQARAAAGRERSPSAAILDSQSVKTTEKGGCVAATTRGKK